MIELLIAVLMILVLLYVIGLVIDRLKLPSDIKTVAYIIIGLIFLFLLLKKLNINL